MVPCVLVCALGELAALSSFCRRCWRKPFPGLRVEFHDQTNDALVRELQSGQIDFGIGAIDSSLPAALQVYPLREDPFVAVLHGDDPLADQPGTCRGNFSPDAILRCSRKGTFSDWLARWRKAIV